MSGLPQFNFPAFYAAAKTLRAMNFEVVSPAELDDEEDAGVAMASSTGNPKDAKRSWGDFLARDVKILADGDIKGIVFLKGWTKSRGARLEATVGLLCKFEFFSYREGEDLKFLTRFEVSEALHHAAAFPI